MSEFKFACPVCGQHITADSSSSGTQLECPTCFRKIVVPQAPASTDPKFILSAAQADKPRPTPMAARSDLEPMARSRRSSPLALSLAAAVVVIAGAVGARWWWQHREAISPGPGGQAGRSNPPPAKTATPPSPPVEYPVPTNILWTLDHAKMAIPGEPVAGSIHGAGFRCERSVLQGGTLNLRQGKAWPPDLGITINLFARQGEELSGKTVDIQPDREKAPAVVLRWKGADQQAVTKKFTTGYALRLVFGQAAGGRMSGRLYIATPDDEQSFAAGTFDAEIRKPPPPKPKGPTTPKPPAAPVVSPAPTVGTQTPPAQPPTPVPPP